MFIPYKFSFSIEEATLILFSSNYLAKLLIELLFRHYSSFPHLVYPYSFFNSFQKRHFYLFSEADYFNNSKKFLFSICLE